MQTAWCTVGMDETRETVVAAGLHTCSGNVNLVYGAEIEVHLVTKG